MATYTQPILETSYLSAQDAVHYRAIMRKMFIENEHMHYRLYKEDIFKLVKQDPDFYEYTIDQLKQDLDQLVNWNNLIAVQDPGIVHTIAEYKNKQYRYSMSERAVEIERLTLRLENLNIEASSLSTNHFLRIDEALKNAEDINSKFTTPFASATASALVVLRAKNKVSISASVGRNSFKIARSLL